MKYDPLTLEEAREMVATLEGFNNKYLGIAANTKRVSDNTRKQVIADVLVTEFGPAILSTNVFNPFGKDTLTAKFQNPNRSAK